MTLLIKLLGIFLILLGFYFLGQNIYFTTNPYPYWWRGLKADGSILFLSAGILMLFFLPRDMRFLALISLAIGTILVFLSSRILLNPTSLWQFCISLGSIVMGYNLLNKGRISI